MKRSQKQQFKIRKWSVFLILVCTMGLVLWPNRLNNGQYTINPIVDDKYSANSMSALKSNISPQNKFAETLDKKLQSENYIGTALIVHHNEIILQKGYGEADEKMHRDNDASTLFQLASIEKSMTAVLIMQQIESGKLSFDTKLSDYYPNVVNANRITISDLITMTSGLSQRIQPTTFESEEDNIDFSAVHVVKIGEPGTGIGWSYQPVNYRLLAGILMKLTNKTFDVLLNQVFNNTYHLNVRNYQDFINSKHRSIGYDNSYDKAYSENQVVYNRETGTGNVAMTTGELYHFYRLMIDKVIIKPPSQLWQTRTGETYAAGMYHEGKYLNAHGILPGFEPTVVISNNGQDAVILLSNQYYKNHSFQPLARELFTKMTAIPTK
ncbi:beta-lactamase family protein [Leuconostoc mesenteroides]|uniref:serine hydrolase domain-containing protein n=1 Tax=Leuconostoc mesenteroides TaxID=1245 RepID=UPI001CBF7A87|nr:serine hydrolase domain-containing protein [Leuconostoc mesenteroides]MBZ1515663.1 beta-lactamase family protein [Leuconostoc mesenteroides]MBZ1539808.1 beta-lactamase family protein [Leuconostoc mesenteroides]